MPRTLLLCLTLISALSFVPAQVQALPSPTPLAIVQCAAGAWTVYELANSLKNYLKASKTPDEAQQKELYNLSRNHLVRALIPSALFLLMINQSCAAYLPPSFACLFSGYIADQEEELQEAQQKDA